MIELMAKSNSAYENLRIRIPVMLKAQWDAILDRKRITQQDAVEAIVELIVNEDDDLIRSMLLGQTTLTPDVLAVVIKRIVARTERRSGRLAGFIPQDRSETEGPKSSRR